MPHCTILMVMTKAIIIKLLSRKILCVWARLAYMYNVVYHTLHVSGQRLYMCVRYNDCVHVTAGV